MVDGVHGVHMVHAVKLVVMENERQEEVVIILHLLVEVNSVMVQVYALLLARISAVLVRQQQFVDDHRHLRMHQ